MVEHLQQRRLLAVASACTAVLPPLLSNDAPAEIAPPRTRAGEDNGSGVCPRDRDSQDSTVAVVLTTGTTNQSSRITSQLSVEEKEHLLSVREEEKLARDVYLTLGAKWNVPIFTNIAASEQQHMDAVKKMIDKYGLSDPVGDNTIGQFTNPEFKRLYDELVDAGSASIVNAYKVGVLIEEMDIVDIRAAQAVTTHTDIQSVYDNLMRGSRNHLRSFYGQIVSSGETYDAQYLTQEEFLAIATSPMETGGNSRRR